MGANPDSIARQGYRFRVGIPAEIRLPGGVSACEAHDLSRSGVQLVGSFEAVPGEKVDFALKTPTGNMVVELSGRVQRVEANPDDASVSVGVELVEMDASRRLALEALIARVLESPSATSFDHLKPNASPQDIKRALESIPLPQRISLSSRAAAKERDYLRQDTNPAVLEALVRNPGLTVAEARLVAGSTHALPGTLDALAQDLRFKDDEEVRIAIASHPRVSLGTAEKVTAGLKLPQIKKLLAKPALNQTLREKLFRRTTQR